MKTYTLDIEFSAMQLLHAEQAIRRRIKQLHDGLNKPKSPRRNYYKRPLEDYRRDELRNLTQIADALFEARKRHDPTAEAVGTSPPDEN